VDLEPNAPDDVAAERSLCANVDFRS
jgi:hypothetical protein